MQLRDALCLHAALSARDGADLLVALARTSEQVDSPPSIAGVT